jgi:hypothetical protein
MKSRPSVNSVPGLWEVDGSWRDMYVFDVSKDDWAKFLAIASTYPSIYSFDGVRQSLPSAGHLFLERSGSHLLAIQVGAASVNCHFFLDSELEVDIDPREVSSADQHDLMLEFAEAVASALRKPILVTPDNAPEAPFLSFEPLAFQWHIHSPHLER